MTQRGALPRLKSRHSTRVDGGFFGAAVPAELASSRCRLNVAIGSITMQTVSRYNPRAATLNVERTNQITQVGRLRLKAWLKWFSHSVV